MKTKRSLNLSDAYISSHPIWAARMEKWPAGSNGRKPKKITREQGLLNRVMGANNPCLSYCKIVFSDSAAFLVTLTVIDFFFFRIYTCSVPTLSNPPFRPHKRLHKRSQKTQFSSTRSKKHFELHNRATRFFASSHVP